MGGETPAYRVGIAAGAEGISAASFVGMAGALYLLGYDGLAFLLGWTGGFVLLGVLIAPHLGAFSAGGSPHFFAERFGGALPRILAVIILVLCSFLLLVVQIYATGLIASRFLGVDFSVAVYIGLLAILLVSMFGGLRVANWRHGALYILLIVAYLTVPILLSIERYTIPVPQLTYGQALADITALEQGFLAQRLADIRSLKPHAQPFVNYDALNFFGLVLCLMAGTASLPHILMRYSGAPSAGEARMAVAWSLLFIFILLITVPAYAAFAKLEVYSTLIGQPLSTLPEWVYTWGGVADPLKPGQGLVNICGKAAIDAKAVLANCGAGHPGLLRLQDFSIDPDVIVIATPEIAGMPYALGALVAVGGIAAALLTANILLFAIAAALSRDAAGNRLDPGAAPRPGLAASVLAVLMAALAAWTASLKPGDMLSMAAWAFSLAAAGLFPALILGIWWRRANMWGSAAGMILGLGVTLYYLVGTRYFPVSFHETWSTLSSASDVAAYKLATLKKAWLAAASGPAKDAAWLALHAHARTIANWWGVKNLSAGVFGLPVGFLAIVLVSLATRAPPAETRAADEGMHRPSGKTIEP